MKVTAENITDEQIRELRDAIPDEPSYGSVKWHRARECEIALGATRVTGSARRTIARARCAEILNARMENEP